MTPKLLKRGAVEELTLLSRSATTLRWKRGSSLARFV